MMFSLGKPQTEPTRLNGPTAPSPPRASEGELAPPQRPRPDLPVFDSRVEVAPAGTLRRSSIEFDFTLKLQGVRAPEVMAMVDHHDLGVGVRIHAGTSEAEVLSDLRAQISMRGDDSLACRVSIPRSIFGEQGVLLAFINPVYDGRFWFYQREAPGSWVALSAPNTDVFTYYIETFNLKRDMT